MLQGVSRLSDVLPLAIKYINFSAGRAALSIEGYDSFNSFNNCVKGCGFVSVSTFSLDLFTGMSYRNNTCAAPESK
jgi:hypothetical protein